LKSDNFRFTGVSLFKLKVLNLFEFIEVAIIFVPFITAVY